MNTETPRDKTVLPLLALRGIVLFPGTLLDFDVGRKKSIYAINEAMKNDQLIFLTAQMDIRVVDPAAKDLYKMGTVARIKQLLHITGENIKVSVEGLYRAHLEEITQDSPFFLSKITPCENTGRAPRATSVEALLRHTQDLIEDYVDLGPKLPEEMLTEIMAAKDPGAIADYIACNILPQVEDKQTILEDLNPYRRLKAVLKKLDKELEVMRLEQDVAQQVHDRIEKGQREYYLREQIKVLSEELNDGGEVGEIDRYHESIKKLK
ncbi:MAG TPA: endopeptidase La, partial [Ruminococcaceae bacterium]|nr:endopeptidase La [Oscillospiraceae bacterium]